VASFSVQIAEKLVSAELEKSEKQQSLIDAQLAEFTKN
jgi:hypothetical protein